MLQLCMGVSAHATCIDHVVWDDMDGDWLLPPHVTTHLNRRISSMIASTVIPGPHTAQPTGFSPAQMCIHLRIAAMIAPSRWTRVYPVVS